MPSQTLPQVLNIFISKVHMGTDDVTFFRYGTHHTYTGIHTQLQRPWGDNEDVCKLWNLILMTDSQQETILTADLTQPATEQHSPSLEHQRASNLT